MLRARSPDPRRRTLPRCGPGRSARQLAAAATSALLLVLAACYRTPPPDTRPREEPAPSSETAEPGGKNQARTQGTVTRSAEVARIEVERLKALGPIYTPYEVSPRLLWDEATQRLLVETLAPVVEEEKLPVNTHTLVWVLIGADGAVADAVVQTTSETEAFDEAALKVAKGLRFVPAGVGGQPVAVWVIRTISLTME